MDRKGMFVLLVLFGCGYGQENSFEWGVLALAGEKTMLTCEDGYSMHMLNDSTPNIYTLSWKVPGGKILHHNHDDNMFAVKEGDNGIQGFVLEIKSFDYHYDGAYICMVEDDDRNATMSILRGINMYDRKYASMSEKYERNIIIAFVATAVFLFLVLGTGLVYKYRWQSEEDKAAEKAKRLGMTSPRANYYVNDGAEELTTKTAADKVKAVNGEGGYENPNMESSSTQL
ncbi:hypothetical protein FSP39_021872 [Pinctada imbricata]|uniref:Ig-like domain-containing protein n=1 Tax=Pinctada imbricata TaxID=66713 RepID=A0AA89C987_PINIB|nr:hypothetical protein FSP39_021872 [Pinctada imbricata]